jgi:hypothetical protein
VASFHCTGGLLEKSAITGNTASSNGGDGGGIGFFGGSSFKVSRCVVSGNSAGFGGGICVDQSSPVIVNCLVRSNAATGTETANPGGGGIAVVAGSPVIRNCTIHGNSAWQGGGLYCSTRWSLGTDCRPWVISTISWANTAGAGGGSEAAVVRLADSVGSATTVLSVGVSDIRGGLGGILAVGGTLQTETMVSDLGGNLNADPSFVNPSNPKGQDGKWRTPDDGFRLDEGSPCVDTGTSANSPTKDLVGVNRPQKSGVDMGAYEGEVTVPLAFFAAPTNEDAWLASSTTITLGGFAWDDAAVTSLTYTLSGATGGSGAVTGTDSWAINSLVLSVGVTTVTVTVFDDSGNSSTRGLTVTCQDRKSVV